MSRLAVLSKVSADIERYGWQCMSALPLAGEQGGGFAYTIGLTETLQHPEIAIFGLRAAVGHSILTGLVDEIRGGTRHAPDLPVAGLLANGFRVQFRRGRPDRVRTCFGVAAHYYQDEDFEMVIMFWPDRQGLFPWESSTPSSQAEALDLV